MNFEYGSYGMLRVRNIYENIDTGLKLCRRHTVNNNSIDYVNNLLNTVYIDHIGRLYVYPKNIQTDELKTWAVYNGDYRIGCTDCDCCYTDSVPGSSHRPGAINGRVVENETQFIHGDIGNYKFNGRPIPQVIQDIIKYMSVGCLIRTLKSDPYDINYIYIVPRNHECAVILNGIKASIRLALSCGYIKYNPRVEMPTNDKMPPIIKSEHENTMIALELHAQNYGFGADIRYGGAIRKHRRSLYDDKENLW